MPAWEQKQCMQGFTACSLERCQICLRKEAGGVCVSITHLKSEVCEEVLESARPLGNMSYSSTYMFIVVSWRALVVSHLRDLIRQGRWLVSKFKGINSSAITNKPTNGGKTRLLGGWCWAGLWLCLIRLLSGDLHMCCFVCVCPGLCAPWLELVLNSSSAPPACGDRAANFALLTINCNYSLFSCHLQASTLSCDLKLRSCC